MSEEARKAHKQRLSSHKHVQSLRFGLLQRRAKLSAHSIQAWDNSSFVGCCLSKLLAGSPIVFLFEGEVALLEDKNSVSPPHNRGTNRFVPQIFRTMQRPKHLRLSVLYLREHGLDFRHDD